MNAAERKTVAVKLLLACDKGDAKTAGELISDDFVYENMERSQSYSMNGQEVSNKLTREPWLKFGVPAVRELTKDGMHFKVDLKISEGNYVAMFGESNAVAKNGKIYANCYCWFFEFSGDKVCQLREYRDTKLSRDVLFD
jgi:ketosteroid isomerase-like protein